MPIDERPQLSAGKVKRTIFSARALAETAALVITLYGALLRIDVLSARYGPLDGPAWAQALERAAVPAARALRPSSFPWGHIDHPYVGGDPLNYLALARDMRSFYQANVREPVFPAVTRGFLVLLGGRDVAVSFASAAASVLAIYVTYLLGTAAFSPIVGLLAAFWLAIERDVISWSPDGWRDDTFMLVVTLAAWRLVRLRQDPGRAPAIWAGVAAAAATLTRVTALTFVVPALCWIVVEAPRTERGLRVRASVLACAVTLLLVGPYLASCAMEFGDPFYAINYHTRYYRSAEGRPLDESVSAFDYAKDELLRRPVAGIDKAAIGLVVWPFSVKWKGFWEWSPTLQRILPWCSIAGLLLWIWRPDGRLLLVILYSSVVPYAVTWNVGGGGEWRFTQHAYPIYLLAAGFAIVQGCVWLVQALERRIVWDKQLSRRVMMTAGLTAAIALAWVGLQKLPFMVTRESLVDGDAVTIPTGGRDSAYFVSGWSSPQIGETVNVRAALGEIATVRLPLPGNKDYWLTLRMDPAETDDLSMQPRVSVFFNGQAVSQIRLGRDPARMGSYRLRIPHDLAGRTFNRLDLVASHTVAAHEAGPRFSWLPAETRVAFRLWYVRLEPVS
jgi:hypothetical protein